MKTRRRWTIALLALVLVVAGECVVAYRKSQQATSAYARCGSCAATLTAPTVFTIVQNLRPMQVHAAVDEGH